MKHNYFPKTSLIIKIHSIKLLTSVTTYLLLLSGNFLTAQTATLNAGSLGPWTVPAGVTSINIQAWGGGGAGGGSNSNNDGGSGGGGGGYTALNGISVTPGQNITYIIGDGGTGSTNANGTAGTATTILSLVANGGGGGLRNTGAGGAGGTSSGGTINTTGFNGGVGGGNSGGNGGNSPNGGAGGTGRSNTDGDDGATPGGGGGGGERSTISSRAGGDGGDGRIVITYIRPTITAQSPTSQCVGNPITITGTNFTGATSVSFNGTAATYMVNNPNSITATVPVGATNGPITVTVPTGFATSGAFTVNASPGITAITGTLTVCPTGTTTLSNATPLGVWTSLNPIIATVDSSGIVTGVNPGNATITYSLTSGGCTSIVSATVNVLTPTAVSGPSAGCIGVPVSFLPNSGGTWNSSNVAIATIDNSGQVIGLSAGTTTFTYTDSATGCSSTTATFTVNESPSINASPTPQSVCSGSAATFNVTASGAGLTYQWHQGASLIVDGGNISGATSSTLTINPTTLANAATDYYCVVSGTCAPSATSNIAALSITEAVAITTHPIVTQTLCSSNTATFSVVATGDGLTYEWYNSSGILTDGGNISGATSPNLTLSNITTADASTYYCIVIGSGTCTSVTSNNSILIVNEGPAITTGPAITQTVCAGDAVSFSIAATGGNLIYQWYKGATQLTNSGNITGVDTATLTISATVPTDAATNYYCVVSNGCLTPVNSINSELIVNEKPFIASYTSSVCSQNAFVLIPTHGLPSAATIIPAGTTYSWSIPIVTGGLTGGTAETGQFGFSQTLSNPTDQPQTAIYTVTPTSGTSGSCIGSPFTITLTVNPAPIVNNLLTIICSGENDVITPTNGSGNWIPAGTTYSWSAPSVTGGMTGGSGGINQASINFTLVNPTNTVQTATYSVTANALGCNGSVFTLSVTVHPKPTVAASVLTQAICSGTNMAAVNLSNPNTITGSVSYVWTRTESLITGLPMSGNGSSISGILSNGTTAALTTTFTIHAVSSELCQSDPITVDVTVNPLATATPSPASQGVCSESPFATVNFNSNIAGGTFTWTRDKLTELINVPASGSGAASFLSGSFTNTTSIPQTTTITVFSSTASCPGVTSSTFTITVSPKPTVTALPASQTVCGELPITNIVLANPNSVAGTVLSWTRNNIGPVTGIPNGTGSTISGTLINTTAVDQLVTFTVTALVNGCSNTTTAQVLVKPSPRMTVSPATQPARCNETAFTAINFNSINSIPGTTFTWTRTNTAEITGMANSGSSLSIPSSILTNTTTTTQTTTITMTATGPAPDFCTSSVSTALTVYAPLIAPVITASQTVCILSTPAPLIMTTLPTGGAPTYTYQWQRATEAEIVAGTWNNIAGATAATYAPPAIGFGGTNYYYRLRITNTCGVVYSNAVFIQIISSVGFTFDGVTDPPAQCPGGTFTTNISSDHAVSSAVRYRWSADPAYITPATGNSPVTVSAIQTFYVWIFPIFDYRTSSANIPFTVQNNTNDIVTTQIAITPDVYNYPGPPSGAIQCSITPQIVSVTIKPKPIPAATIPATTICSGTNAGIVLSSNVNSFPTTLSWSRNNTGTVTSLSGNSGSVSVPAGSTYVIPNILTNITNAPIVVTYSILATTNGCSNPVATTIQVTVNPSLLPGTVGPNQTLCTGADPAPINQVTAATGVNLTYQWQWSTAATGPIWTDIPGETGISYDPGVLTTTTYFRRLVISSLGPIVCSVANTTAVAIIVNTINAGSITGNQTICSNTIPTTFNSTALGTALPTMSYQWQFSTTGCGGPWTPIASSNTASYTPLTPLTVTTYYRRLTNSTAGPCSEASNCIVVTVNSVSAGIIGTDQVMCGNDPAAFTETTPTTGAGFLTFQWQSSIVNCSSGWGNIPGPNGMNQFYDPPSGLLQTTYYRRITTSTLGSSICTATSNCITVTANSVTGGTIDGNRSVCINGDPAPFTSTTAGSGTAMTYSWEISTTGFSGPWTPIALETGATYDAPGPISQTTYFRRITSSQIGAAICTAASNVLTVFINNVTPAVISGNQSVCNDDPGVLNATTLATGTGTVNYQWESSIGSCSGPWTPIAFATGSSYDPPPVTQTTYFRLRATSVVIAPGVGGSSCPVYSNCVVVTSNAKTWAGSLSTDWNNGVNWTPNGVPTAINCVVVPNTPNKPEIIGSNYDAYAYSLTILAGGNLDVLSGNSITVTDVVTVNPSGGFTIENNASLVQINNVPNIGNINVERTTQPMYRYDYTYWGSPLTLASNFTLGNLSPTTQPDKYYSWNPTTVTGGNGSWIQESIATVMDPNKGYIVRAPQTYSMNPTVTQAYTANFIGVPNNGDIPVTISVGSQPALLFNDKLNLLGNPYPSAINADLFLNHSNNVGLIDGTIYFWTHHSPPSAAYVNPFYGNYSYNYTAGDYATYTTLGGTNTVPTGYGSIPGGYIGATPNGYIAAGQGFFVKGLANGNALFTNAMRERGNNADFFRITDQTEKQRVWLNLANAQGGFSQAMVGYVDGATLEYDRGFDGSSFSGNFVSLYSVQADAQTLTIQGRPAPFVDSDQVALGYHATALNNYTIGIDHFDEAFDSQPIYLEDKLLNIIHDIKASPYVFASEIGTFNTRFVLRYTNSFLSVQNPNATIGLTALIVNQRMMVQASESIVSIQVFDISGKHIKTYEPENAMKKYESEFIFAEGVYVAKITLESGAIETRKLINSN